MDTAIKVIGAYFVLDGKTFTTISPNAFKVNERVVVFNHHRKSRELQVKYQTIGKTNKAIFEEIYPENKKEPIDELIPKMFEENDEIHFTDPEKLFTRIIAQKTGAKISNEGSYMHLFFCL